MANPESSPQINWDYYKKNVTTPGLVEKFKKEYESLTIPFPADKYTSLIDNEEKQMVKYFIYRTLFLLYLVIYKKGSLTYNINLYIVCLSDVLYFKMFSLSSLKNSVKNVTKKLKILMQLLVLSKL